MMGLMGVVSRPPEIVGYKRVPLSEIKPVRLSFCMRFRVLYQRDSPTSFLIIAIAAYFRRRRASKGYQQNWQKG
jgi:hypothetical protein